MAFSGKVENRFFTELLGQWATAVRGLPLPQPPNYDGSDISLNNIVEHTDDVIPGSCFVARVRAGSDGHPFIGIAVDKGAALIIGQRDLPEIRGTLKGVPYLRVQDSAECEAWLSAAWYGFPGSQMVIIGVTGTDGKSTTSNLIRSILQTAGQRTGMLSTIKATIGDHEEPLALHVTTPEAPVIQHYLRQMVDAGVSHCVLETTSHGLEQHRVDAIDYDIAVVTNITHEHLDYHGSLEAYRKAKSLLFAKLNLAPTRVAAAHPAKAPSARTAILNADDYSYSYLANIPTPRQITYGIQEAADIRATKVSASRAGMSFSVMLDSAADQLLIRTPLVGDFNVYNILASAAAARALNIDSASIKDGIESLEPLVGRMQTLDRGQPFQVVVDFAHTPNALGRAIEAARGMAPGRIIAVFGSAGKRDREKRRMMAEISARKADLTILTAEDPRTESLNEILEMMAQGCRYEGCVEGRDFWRVPDRGQAIYFALTLARERDLVLICGKGHEQSMCFGTIEYPWDDVVATETALDAFLKGEPMVDLGLPTYNRSEPRKDSD